MNKFLRISSAILFINVAVFAQDKSDFTLEEAQQFGVENNLNRKNAALGVDESKKVVKETWTIGLPQVNGSATFQNFIDIPVQIVDASFFDPNAAEGTTMPVQFGTENTANYGIQANQLLFDGTYIVGLQASKTYLQLSEEGLEKTDIQIKDGISLSYYNVLVAEENERIITENVGRLESQYKEFKALHEKGFVEDIEVDQLEIIYLDAQKRVETTKRYVQNAYRTLNFQMGREIESELTLSDNLQDIYSKYDENALLNKELNMDEHIDYKMMLTQERIAELQLKAENASRLPSLSAFFNYSENAFANSLDLNEWFPTTIIGLQLNVPIFKSFATEHRVAQRKIQLERIQNDKKLMEDNLKLQVSNARTSYVDALEQFQTARKNMELSEKILDKTTIKQKNGLASSLDVTVANNQYLESQGNYIQSLFNLLSAKSTLDKALNNY